MYARISWGGGSSLFILSECPLSDVPLHYTRTDVQAHFSFSTSLLQVCSGMQLSKDQEPVCSNYNENGPGRFLVSQVSIIIKFI